MTVCPFRTRGQEGIICSKANTREENTTSEAGDEICQRCGVPKILDGHRCKYLDFVVVINLLHNGEPVLPDIPEKIICTTKMAELRSADNCTPNDCPLFEPREDM